MSVLYRKYRPQLFKDVVGQEHITTILTNEMKNNVVGHAYMFVGPRGTGKTTLARIFARAVNCEERKRGAAEPCNTCGSCTRIIAGQSLDIHEIDAATHTQVDNIRDVVIASVRTPTTKPGGWRVFIIDEVHMLSKHAFNALLKTLEEPPERVMFIMATTEARKVPETIVSRCERFDFKRIPLPTIVENLEAIAAHEKLKLSADVIRRVAEYADGSLRDSQSLLGQIASLAGGGVPEASVIDAIVPPRHWQTVHDILSWVASNSKEDVYERIESLVHAGVDPERILRDAVEYVRLVVVIQASPRALDAAVASEVRALLTETQVLFSPADLLRLLSVLLKELSNAPWYSSSQTALELALAQFFSLRAEPEMTALKRDAAAMTTGEGDAVSGKDISTLKSVWAEVLSNLKSHNHSLAVFLKVAHPLSLEGSQITLGFKYPFHAETVLEGRNRAAVERAIGAVLKRKVTIDCVVDSEYTERHKNFNGSDEQQVRDVLDAMGGGEMV